MFQDVADWGSQAGAGRITAWKTGRTLLISHDPAWDQIQQQRQYGHFVRIPARILSCLKYFNVRVDRLAANEVLSAYYLFIGVVDNWIDSGAPALGQAVFDLLEAHSFDHGIQSDVVLVTVRLRRHISEQIKPEVIKTLRELYAAVADERSADSLEQYLDRRKAVGRMTADVSYLLIKPFLSHDEPILRTFMQRVGATGCLLDTVIDWSADRQQGLLNFEPTYRDYVRLVSATAWAGILIALDHPRLCRLFAQSTLDIFRDRFLIRPAPAQVAQ